jgi:hydrogenase nickel incorporation protein HypA/HybF
MHELSIALSIVDGALEELQRRGATEASTIHLRLGRLAGVDKEALQFSYAVACQETPLAGSRLVIEDVDVAIFCPVCKNERLTNSFPILRCPGCGALAERVVHGEELEIRAMEIAG